MLFVPEAIGTGGVDMTALEQLLTANARRPLIIGAFTAASNITGMLYLLLLLFLVFAGSTVVQSAVNSSGCSLLVAALVPNVIILVR